MTNRTTLPSTPPRPRPALELGEPELVVGVGASAGGLEALEAMFRTMPAHTGMAFVVVQHLSPNFESRMEELLSRHTRLAVCTVEDGVSLRRDTIHLAPADKKLLIEHGRVSLSQKSATQAFSLPIDELFKSLAESFGSRSVAVVLSGTGSDGSRGVLEVHRAGGFVLVQLPETAKFDGMPRSALASGVADEPIAPEDMGATLLRYLSEEREPSLTGEHTPEIEAAVREILGLLRTHHGIDFNHYKPSTVMRRVERRLMLATSRDAEEYLALLRTSPKELNALYHDLLIGVTAFFRDTEAFDIMERRVVPTIVAGAEADEEIRAWVAGCATGEEAYALAMLFHEQLATRSASAKLTLFATDVHGASLEIAGAGRYPIASLDAVGPERLERWFVPDGPGFLRVCKPVRDSIVFARHDVLSDAPFTRLHLVSCRNLLIYLKGPAQNRALSLFHFGLQRGGHLFLGRSESPGELADGFEIVDGSAKIYRKTTEERPSVAAYAPMRKSAGPTFETGVRRATEARLLRLYDRLLDKHVPPSVLVDQRHDLLHCFAGAERYLRVSPGRVTTNVLDVVHPAIRAALAAALHQACTSRGTVAYDAIEVPGDDGDSHLVRLKIDTLVDGGSGAVAYHVMFDDRGEALAAKSHRESGAQPAQVSRDYVSSLEAQLQSTRESLQATVEELQASNEELQATNEELLAANEELQSTNEELHSVNEELHTVNAENERRIVQLTELNNDIDNLLQSTDVGVLFVDKELRIRRFTKKAADLFNLLPSDVGRRFPSFSSGLEHGDVAEDIQSVIAGGDPVERELEPNGEQYLLRILPYRSDGGVGGAVLTLIDVKAVKEREAKLRRLSAIVESSEDAILAKTLDGTIISWNEGADRLYGYAEEEVIGRSVELLVPAERREELAAVMRRIANGERVESFETVRLRKGGVPVEVSVSVAPLHDERGRVIGASAIGRDITRWRRTEAQVQRALEQRDRFIALLSHELRNPLMGITMAVAALSNGQPNGGQQRARQVLERQTQYMTRLLDDLVDVSRVRRGAISMRKELFDLRETVEAALDAVRERAQRKGLELTVDVGEEPIWVHGDAARLQQLEVNLLRNAVKFTPESKRVRFALRADGGRGFVEVSDEGIGLTPGTEEEIFEPFYQDERAAHSAGGRGMGLGLALVRAIAEAHGGYVVGKSRGPDRGSEFTVELPMARPPANRGQHAKDGVPHVLIVEDDEDNRQLLELLLSDRGFPVTTAECGGKALEVLAEEHIDVALVDLGLPDMSGLEVAERARAMLPRDELTLVALTGHGRPEDRERVLAAGFDKHMVKPVPPDRILRLLESVK